MRITKARKVSYLGVPATVWEVRQAGAAGLRVQVTRWNAKAVGQPVEHEADTVVLRLVEGNATNGTLQVHRTDVLESQSRIGELSDEDVNNLAAGRIAEVAK